MKSEDELLTSEEEANLMMHILAAETFKQQADIYESYRQYARADVAGAKHILEETETKLNEYKGFTQRLKTIPWTGHKHYSFAKRLATPFVKIFAVAILGLAGFLGKKANDDARKKLGDEAPNS